MCHLEKLLKKVFGQEFVTCQTVGKILPARKSANCLIENFAANSEKILQASATNQLK